VVSSRSTFSKSEEFLGPISSVQRLALDRFRFLGASAGIACCDLILAEKLIQEDEVGRRVNAVLCVVRCYVLQSCSAASSVECKCGDSGRAAR
jgi:hypothetical protein